MYWPRPPGRSVATVLQDDQGEIVLKFPRMLQPGGLQEGGADGLCPLSDGNTEDILPTGVLPDSVRHRQDGPRRRQVRPERDGNCTSGTDRRVLALPGCENPRWVAGVEQHHGAVAGRSAADVVLREAEGGEGRKPGPGRGTHDGVRPLQDCLPATREKQLFRRKAGDDTGTSFTGQAGSQRSPCLA